MFATIDRSSINALSGLSIGAALDTHLPDCRRLLPAVFPASGRAPELTVASGPEGIRGALAMAWVPGGFSILLHVLPAWRRGGIGRALVAHAAALAQGETPALRAWSPVSQGSAADAFLRACGFSSTRRLLVFETDDARYGDVLSALLRRAVRRLPDGLALQPLSAAPQAAADLVAGEFGVPRPDVMAKLDAAHPDAYDGRLSQVLMQNGIAVGAILGRRYGDVIEVDINVVAPGLRHGLGNLMLLEAIGRLSLEAGVQRFRFACEEHVRDTINLGARSNAVRRPDQLSYTLALTPPVP